jgi:hypothetical protein
MTCCVRIILDGGMIFAAVISVLKRRGDAEGAALNL